MKTLKESLLSDIDTTIAQGNEWEKNLKAEIKEFLKVISTAKYYEATGYKNYRRTSFFVPNALKQLGYDANHIEIAMHTMDEFYVSDTKDWILTISLTKRSDDNREFIHDEWEKTVYMGRWEFNKWNDVIKELIKPATKSLDTFKKFLNNMEKYNMEEWNEQLVGKQSLLK